MAVERAAGRGRMGETIRRVGAPVINNDGKKWQEGGHAKRGMEGGVLCFASCVARYLTME